MPHLMTRRTMFLLGAATAAQTLAPLPAMAAAQSYRLDAARSNVGFGVSLGEQIFTGAMPVRSATLMLDFDDISRSRVDVTLNAAGTKMGVFFATEAVLSPDLLDVARNPNITFRSTAVRQGATPSEAVVTGNLTVKGVTKPVTLRTLLTQDRATVGQANPELTLNLRGQMNRHDFGVSAYRDLVGPMIRLDIQARIKRA